MMIYEKLDTIAILKAIGFNSSDVKRDFSSPCALHWTIGELSAFSWVTSPCLGIERFHLKRSLAHSQDLPSLTSYQILHYRRHFSGFSHHLPRWIFSARKQVVGSSGYNQREMTKTKSAGLRGEKHRKFFYNPIETQVSLSSVNVFTIQLKGGIRIRSWKSGCGKSTLLVYSFDDGYWFKGGIERCRGHHAKSFNLPF